MKKILIRLALVFFVIFISIFILEKLLRYSSKKAAEQAYSEFVKKNKNLSDVPAGQNISLLKDSPVDKRALMFTWDCYYGFKYMPNQKTLNKTTNSFGFHDQEWSIEKDTDVYRIALLGGSVADGLADSETIDIFLEQILNKHKKSEVMNFGTTGMMSVQERILFINEVLKFKPDMVIFLDGINELNPLLYSLKPGEHFYWLRAQYDFSLGEPFSQTLKKMWIKQSLRFSEKFFLYKFLYSSLGYETDFLGKNITEKNIADAVEIYNNNIKIIKLIADNQQIKTIFFIQPLIYNKKNPSLYEKYFIESKPAYYNNLYYKGYELMLKDNADIKKPLIDIFNNIPYKIFVDNCHVVPLGNKIIAENMALEIMKKW